MKKEVGFSLIELMVVLLIAAILAGIAIVRYSTYKAKALDTRSLTTLNRLIGAQEGYFIDNENYAASTTEITNWSDEGGLITEITSSSPDSWSGYSYHSGGIFKYCYSGTNKSSIATVTGADTPCP